MKKLICFIMGMIGGAASVIKLLENKIIKKEKDIYRFQSYYNMLRTWVGLNQEGKYIGEYLINKGYHTIAIYGMGEIGVLFYEEIKNTPIKIKYGIDRNTASRCEGLEIIKPSENMEKVDVIVVTPIFVFDEVREALENVVDCPVVALDDLIYEIK